jgi:Clp amino terminal domain, pathogenicity island component
MPGMLSEELEYLLNAAFLRAKERRHKHLTVEHIVLALTDAKSPTNCGACVWDTRGRSSSVPISASSGSRRGVSGEQRESTLTP